MGLLDLLSKVRKVQSDRRAEIVASYAGLKAAVADGEEPDPETVARILDEAGKTPEDLAADVEHLLARRKKQEALAGEADARERRRALQAQRDRIEAEFEEARRVYDRAMQENFRDAQAADSDLRRIEEAKQWLATNCRDPQIVEPLAAAREEKAKLGQERADLRVKLGMRPSGEVVGFDGSIYGTLRDRERELEAALERQKDAEPGLQKMYDRDIEQARAAVEEWKAGPVATAEARMREIDQRSADLDAEIERLERAKIYG